MAFSDVGRRQSRNLQDLNEEGAFGARIGQHFAISLAKGLLDPSPAVKTVGLGTRNPPMRMRATTGSHGGRAAPLLLLGQQNGSGCKEVNLKLLSVRISSLKTGTVNLKS
jgi:hypothetical protein